MGLSNGDDEDDDQVELESLLGRLLVKRQRVNSEATFKKQEFSFMPTQKPTSKPFSFSPTCGQPAKQQVRPRDMKAAGKQFQD